MASETLVLDASVALKWCLPDEDHVDAADRLFARFVAGVTQLTAPDYIRHELAAVLSYASLRSPPRLTADSAKNGIAAFLRLQMPTHDSDTLLRSASLLVPHYRIALYDALYLALALRLSLPLITADSSFYQRVKGSDVLWLPDWFAATEGP